MTESTFNSDSFHDYVVAHGAGIPTPEGYEMGRRLIAEGDDYATAGHEVVARGLVQDEGEDDEPQTGTMAGLPSGLRKQLEQLIERDNLTPDQAELSALHGGTAPSEMTDDLLIQTFFERDLQERHPGVAEWLEQIDLQPEYKWQGFETTAEPAQAMAPGMYENDQAPAGWYAVSDDNGIVAYAPTEEMAFALRNSINALTGRDAHRIPFLREAP